MCFVHSVFRHTAVLILLLTSFAGMHLMTSKLNWAQLPPRHLRRQGRLRWRSRQKTHTMVRRNCYDAKQGFPKNWFNIRYKYALLKITASYNFVNKNIFIVWGFLELAIDQTDGFYQSEAHFLFPILTLLNGMCVPPV